MKKILSLLVLCSLVLFSCKKEVPDDNKEQNEPVLTITSEDSFSFTSEGGTGVILYTLENPIEGILLESYTQAEWIELNATEVGKIDFTVFNNSDEESRQGTIVISYGEQSYNIEIEQDGYVVEDVDPVLNITSDSPLTLPKEGGEFVITYEIENPVEEWYVEVRINDQWILTTTHTYTESGQLTLEAMPNNSYEERSTTLKLVYGEIEQLLEVTQLCEEFNAPQIPEDAIELPYLSCIYFGNTYGATSYDYNYSMVIATHKNVYDPVTGYYDIYANCEYMFIDLYSATPSQDYNLFVKIPVGVYEFDLYDSCQAGTFGYEYSYHVVTDEYSTTEDNFREGIIYVTNEYIYIEVTDINGNELKYVCYETTADNSDNFGPDSFTGGIEHSTLTGDLNMDFSSGYITSVNYGDYYVIGKNNWSVYVTNSSTGETLGLEILSDFSMNDFSGTHVVSNKISEYDSMVLPGFVDAYGETMWSWYRQSVDGNVENAAPLVEGTITFTNNNDGTFTVVMDVLDDKGNNITCNTTLPADFVDYPQPGHSKLREPLGKFSKGMFYK